LVSRVGSRARGSGERPFGRAITSARNPQVAEVRRIVRRGGRDEGGRAVIEGPNLIREALDAGVPVERGLFTPRFLSEPEGLELARSVRGAGAEVVAVSSSLMGRMSGLVSTPGALAVVRPLRFQADDLVKGGRPLVVACSGVQDPGNLGTLVRTARAAGADGVVVGAGTVDPLNAKVVRSAAGSLFWMPVMDVCLDPRPLSSWLRAHGLKVVLAVPRGGRLPYDVDMREACAILLGSEGHGLEEEEVDPDETVTVPQREGVDSLNVAVCGAVLLYEAVRQRRYAETARRWGDEPRRTGL